MKKIQVITLGLAMFLAFPLISYASMVDLQGVLPKVTVQVTTDSGGTVSIQKMVETNASKVQNVSMAFDNMSGIVHRGSISFGDTGMWVGFGGTALAPTHTMLLGNMLEGGVIRMSGDVAYNVATNTFTGTGTVVEFAGTLALNGVMKNGWSGIYGTPAAGFPGGGWMPAWGGGNGNGGMMPGWGGTMSAWTSGPGGTPGLGMMGATAAGMMSGTGSGGMMSGTGSGTIAVGGQAGTALMWVSPDSAVIININDGVPDYTNPVAAGLSIAIPPVHMTIAP